jgi:hypothetical protein
MQSVCGYLNVFEIDAMVTMQDLDVVGRDVDNPDSGASSASQVLSNAVVKGRPIGSKPSPVVEDIAHQIDDVRLVPPQKIEKTIRPTPWRTKMDVGKEQAAQAPWLVSRFASCLVPIRQTLGLRQSHADSW